MTPTRAAIQVLFFFVLLCYWMSITDAASSEIPVHAWEGTLSIPTYPWGPDDVNPRFEQLEDTIIYPYAMQDSLSSQKEPRDYKALFLENEFLKVTCLPELGGRIHSVLDKTTGQEMFDKNEVIKPGLIAMRGAWISGGIEWNTGPHGHTVTAVSPVNAVIRENPDGSATLFLSNTEKIFRTRWTVEVTLYPGKSFLHERIRIENPTDGVHPYYFWNCTAFPCLPGTRFIFPISLGTDHYGKNAFHWPIHEGKDLTWLRHYDCPTSVFAYQCVFDFFGAYDVDLDRGVVQYADHTQLPGKKAWTWGQSGDGIVAQKALTDDGSQYIEVQSGPLLTQSDYGLLKPHEDVAWEEYWYPVHGLGEGFEYATRDVAIQTIHNKDRKTLDLTVLSTSVFPSARIRITPENTAGLDHPAFTQTMDLTPNSPVPVHYDNLSGVTCTVVIESSKGENLAIFKTPLPIPKMELPAERPEPPEDAELTVEQEFAKALLADKETNRVGARADYEKVLSKDAVHVPSLIGLAVLDIESGLYENAEKYLRKALDLQPENGDAWYFLGVVLLRQEELKEAGKCAEKVTSLLPDRSIGPDLAGRIQMRIKQYDAAVASFKVAVERDPMDSRAQDHLLMALWSVGSRQSGLAYEGIQRDPRALLPHMLLSWLAFDYVATGMNEVFPQMGDSAFEAVESALSFGEVGLSGEAYRVLSTYIKWCEQMGFATPTVVEYPLAHFARLIGVASIPVIENQTAINRPDRAFPSRPEEIPIFQTALETNPNDAVAHLMLGNLLAGLLRLDEAIPHWEQAAALDPNLSVAFRNLGLHAWKKEKDLTKAESLYHKAITARPKDQILCRDLAKILIESTKTAEAVSLIEGFPLAEIQRNDVLEILALAYNTLHRYDDTIHLLSTVSFSNWEGQTSTRDVWVAALMERGKASLEAKKYDAALEDFEMSLTYPENLGVGCPVSPDESEALYWKGMALVGLGRNSEARECWEAGAKGGEFQEKCKKALAE